MTPLLLLPSLPPPILSHTHTHTPPPPPPPGVVFKLVTLFVVAVSRACTNLAVDMESHVDGARGAAARRRQRRLRAQWRHEKQSVAMALAEALHHSSGPTTLKVVERREGPEGEVRETHDGPRAQE